jgi:hypothetical protein
VIAQWANPTTPFPRVVVRAEEFLEEFSEPSSKQADDGSRTRDLRLGKPTLYRLSYVRKTGPTNLVVADGSISARAREGRQRPTLQA